MVLKEFCESSGHKLSTIKTRIFFSHNVNSSEASHISNEFVFCASHNLSVYLEVLLLHNRVATTTYRYILEKVQSKLSRWKTNLLSMVGRLILAKFVLMEILTCIMQTIALPSSICNKINGVVKNFFLGSSN